jgi:putative transposase
MPVARSMRSGGTTASAPPPTIYKWKAKYGGLEASDVKRLKELEHENSRLKRLYADLSLENAALKDVIATKL